MQKTNAFTAFLLALLIEIGLLNNLALCFDRDGTLVLEIPQLTPCSQSLKQKPQASSLHAFMHATNNNQCDDCFYLLILGNLRAAFIVALTIPLSMLLAGIGMKYPGISANLMSLGAIDFGLLVDASVVIIENIMRRMKEKAGDISITERVKMVVEAVREVGTSVTVGMLLIMAVYIPILSLGGIEGQDIQAHGYDRAYGTCLLTPCCPPPYAGPGIPFSTRRCSPGKGRFSF